MARVACYVDAAYTKDMLFVAAVVVDDQGIYYIGEESKIKVKSSVHAEYLAILFGLKTAQERGITELIMLSDSETAVNQLRGNYKLKKDYLKPYCNAVKNIVGRDFYLVVIKYVSGKKNMADKYCRKLKKEYMEKTK